MRLVCLDQRSLSESNRRLLSIEWSQQMMMRLLKLTVMRCLQE